MLSHVLRFRPRAAFPSLRAQISVEGRKHGSEKVMRSKLHLVRRIEILPSAHNHLTTSGTVELDRGRATKGALRSPCSARLAACSYLPQSFERWLYEHTLGTLMKTQTCRAVFPRGPGG